VFFEPCPLLDRVCGGFDGEELTGMDDEEEAASSPVLLLATLEGLGLSLPSEISPSSLPENCFVSRGGIAADGLFCSRGISPSSSSTSSRDRFLPFADMLRDERDDGLGVEVVAVATNGTGIGKAASLGDIAMVEDDVEGRDDGREDGRGCWT